MEATGFHSRKCKKKVQSSPLWLHKQRRYLKVEKSNSRFSFENERKSRILVLINEFIQKEKKDTENI